MKDETKDRVVYWVGWALVATGVALCLLANFTLEGKPREREPAPPPPPPSVSAIVAGAWFYHGDINTWIRPIDGPDGKRAGWYFVRVADDDAEGPGDPLVVKWIPEGPPR